MEGEHGGTTVCVTGASGFIGSWLVMRLLERGYYVRATVRDPANMSKVRHLLDLPNAATRLSLWKADLVDEGSFDDAVHGCAGVFHVATRTDFSSVKDPESEVIKPTVNGVLNIMRSCSKAESVKRLIYTSTTGTISRQQHPQSEYDESFWTDIDFCRAQKMAGWMYLVAKTMAEKAAWEFAKENGLDLVTIQPSLVLGPFITPLMPASIKISLALITRNETFYPLLARLCAVHLDDVCNAHIYLFEHVQAKGRYICSSHCFTIFEITKWLSQKYPEFDIPTKFEGIDESLNPIPCSSKKLVDLGFKFKYNSEECHVGGLFTEAIESCREKRLMPL
ncbi:Dihydroflavonol 4-reductase [Actinidia chinensis var. chinensis]|uniref:Dihydroflavonol 4-reductase n=1 Tax=Actinidia chinensis var. chinensis TaxID=1590841 RepID=A0A2R6Q0E0_ACTCC|nr:Dihydroflavonol 4-reductase [Actinidia chinensis var. chinensis]